MQPWPYAEPSRFEELLDRLAVLRARIAAMARDPVSPEERAETAEEQRKKSEDLFKKLRDEVDRNRRK